MNKYVVELNERYPKLAPLSENIENAINAITECYKNGGKVLLCGNGGSASDCAHIVGELMKGFLKMRPTGSNHPVISKLPICLETPNDIDGYAREIALLSQLVEKKQYKGDVAIRI